ncbi:hypothetical protein ACLB1G_17715 [Oxalobacteraceae bacterium A2-2]
MHSHHSRRRGWLAVIAGVHVLAFIAWQRPQRPLAAPAMPRAAITYLLAPLPAQRPVARAEARPEARQPAPPRLDRPARRPAKTAPMATSPEQLQTITAPPQDPQPEPAPPQAITQTALPPDPFALPAKPELDVVQRSIAGAAAADKAARKEAYTQRDRKLVNEETALAAAIGKAYRGSGTGRVEIIGPDGSRITKFILPGGVAICYKTESNNAGRDAFRDSSRVIVSNCPK